jgi:DNA-binding response OmpR family regulator
VEQADLRQPGEGSPILLLSRDPATIAAVRSAGTRKASLMVVRGLGDAIHAARGHHFWALVVDLETGIDLAGLETLAGASPTPLLLVAPADQASICIAGLLRGASEYLLKPVDPEELTARLMSAVLRPPQRQRRRLLRLDGLSLQPMDRSVAFEGHQIQLTPREFEVLYALARQAGHVISKEDLFEEVWGSRHYGDLNLIEQHVSSLRQKLDRIDAPYLVETIRHAGYRLSAGLHRVPDA